MDYKCLQYGIYPYVLWANNMVMDTRSNGVIFVVVCFLVREGIVLGMWLAEWLIHRLGLRLIGIDQTRIVSVSLDCRR